MNKTQKLQKVTEAIHKACPDLLEPTFGCLVRLYLPNQSMTEISAIVQENHGLYRLNCGKKWFTQEQLKFDKRFEILGQPIGIASILRTCKRQYREVKGIKFRHDKMGTVKTPNDDFKEVCRIIKHWNPEKDNINDQEEQTIKLLFNFLFDEIIL